MEFSPALLEEGRITFGSILESVSRGLCSENLYSGWFFGGTHVRDLCVYLEEDAANKGSLIISIAQFYFCTLNCFRCLAFLRKCWKTSDEIVLCVLGTFLLGRSALVGCSGEEKYGLRNVLEYFH